MEHGVPDAGVPLIGIEPARVAPPPMPALEHLVDLLDCRKRLPRLDRRFVELDENAFTMDLARGDPIRFAAGDVGHLRSLVWITRLFGCLHSGESQQRIDLAKPLEEQHSFDALGEALR